MFIFLCTAYRTIVIISLPFCLQTLYQQLSLRECFNLLVPLHCKLTMVIPTTCVALHTNTHNLIMCCYMYMWFFSLYKVHSLMLYVPANMLCISSNVQVSHQQELYYNEGCDVVQLKVKAEVGVPNDSNQSLSIQTSIQLIMKTC